jgi:molybdate transport system substrate-binding protein
MRAIPWLLGALSTLAGACAEFPEERTCLVLSAVSLRPVLETFEPGRLTLVSASSDVLAQQILRGAAADLFLSADEHWLDELERAGRLEPQTRVELATNQLAVVQPRSSAGEAIELRSAADLLGCERLAIANPASVPAGRYARDWLEREGLWSRLEARAVPALDARAALAMVESGAAEAGVVYASDARASARVRIAFDVPRDRAGPVRYGGALVRGAARPQAARALLDELRSSAGRAAFERAGFGAPEEP